MVQTRRARKAENEGNSQEDSQHDNNDGARQGQNFPRRSPRKRSASHESPLEQKIADSPTTTAKGRNRSKSIPSELEATTGAYSSPKKESRGKPKTQSGPSVKKGTKKEKANPKKSSNTDPTHPKAVQAGGTKSPPSRGGQMQSEDPVTDGTSARQSDKKDEGVMSLEIAHDNKDNRKEASQDDNEGARRDGAIAARTTLNSKTESINKGKQSKGTNKTETPREAIKNNDKDAKKPGAKVAQTLNNSNTEGTKSATKSTNAKKKQSSKSQDSSSPKTPYGTVENKATTPTGKHHSEAAEPGKDVVKVTATKRVATIMPKKQASKLKPAPPGNELTSFIPGYTAPLRLDSSSLDSQRPGLEALRKRALVTDKSTSAFVKGTLANKQQTKTMLASKPISSKGIVKSSFTKGTKREPPNHAGDRWFGMVPTPLTEDVKRDLTVIRNRNYLDPKRFYKSADTPSSFVQVGTVVEGTGEYFSSRLTKKQRRANLTEELMADPAAADYAKRKSRSLQQEKIALSKKQKYWKNIKSRGKRQHI